jgi:NADH-quinone oxidoreductase subunit H
MLVALLVFIAYILYADRKIWAAVQLAPWSECGRAVGSVPVICRPSEVRVQRACDSVGCQQGRVFAGAPLLAVTLALASLGSDSRSMQVG